MYNLLFQGIAECMERGIKFQEDLFDDIAGAGGKKKVVKNIMKACIIYFYHILHIPMLMLVSISFNYIFLILYIYRLCLAIHLVEGEEL